MYFTANWSLEALSEEAGGENEDDDRWGPGVGGAGELANWVGKLDWNQIHVLTTYPFWPSTEEFLEVSPTNLL